MTTPQVIAAIDIGTNSTHMVVAQMTPVGFEVITREKSQTRLGEGGGDMKKLGPAAIRRGVTALQHMKKIADVHRAHVVAVATSAVREASNAEEFVNLVRNEAGIEIEIISGLEEARLIHSAVLRALPVTEEKSMLIDIGGGSTEIVIFTAHTEYFARSFKLGSVRMTHRFFSSESVTKSDITAARRFTTSAIEPVRHEIESLRPSRAIVTSGTGETIARMCHLLTSSDEPRSMNGATFTTEQLRIVVRMITEATDNLARSSLPGMDPSRADIILAGALILEETARSFSLKHFTYCDYALREGLLINEMQRLLPGAPDDSRHVAIASATKLAKRCDNDFEHALTVARLSTSLFDELSQHFELDQNDRLYLEVASLLANVGMTVAHAKHHLHSYYIIRNADLLGLTDHEIEIIAQVARYHRKSEPKPHHEPFAHLSQEDQYKVRLLASILRLAIGLDRTHDARVTKVAVSCDKNTLTIWVHAAPKIDADLNVYAANERSSLLSDVFALKVIVARATHPSRLR